MLQRIQTVYLLIIMALTIAILFLPLAVLQSGDQLFTFDATGISTMAAQPELIYPTWGLFALTIVISLLALLTIFLFKKRILQISTGAFFGSLEIIISEYIKKRGYLITGISSFFCLNLIA